MKVQQISATAQKFDGKTYYLCGQYFQRKGKRLHRAVWEYHNGNIPNGYHIHHIDGDRSNNNIENLTLMQGHDHLHGHMCQPERRARSAAALEKARDAACRWHGSPAGMAYHSALGKENWAKREMRTYVCSFCGKKFETKHVYAEGANHFCHQNCKAKYRTRRLRRESEEHQESGAR